MDVVFVKFPQEGSAGRSGSVEDNFTLKEDVVFFCIEVECTPCMTCSRPRCPLRSYYMVHSEYNYYFLGILPILDVDLTYIFRPVFPFVCFIEDRSQYYKVIFNTYMFSNIVIMTLNYVLCPISVQNSERCTF